MPRERRTALALRAAVAALAAVSLLTIAGEFGRHPYLELSTHFRLQYAIGAVLCALAFAALRSPAALAAAVACAAVNTAYLAPYYAPASPLPAAASATSGARVRLMLSNVYLGNKDYGALLETVREERPDVLVLQEVTGAWWKRLGALRAEYPYYNALPRRGGSGIALFSRLPVSETEILTFGESTQPGMFARLDAGGRPLSVLALHPPTPMRLDKFRFRNAQFAEAAARMRETEGPRVLIGDLNSTPWSPYYQDLVRDSGLRDARVGAGVGPTWPMPLPSFLRIPIDHCMTGGEVRVESIRTGGRTGSDHRPLVVDVTVP
jgi:endonuclease/exonuclease/phosphatase (EEP) superfamily protein YafD